MSALLAKKCRMILNSIYGHAISKLPKTVAPETLGKFLIGNIYSRERYVGFTNRVFRDLKIKFIESNIIAGTDGQYMVVGAPLFSPEWWSNQIGIEGEILRDIAVVSILGISAHEAAHALITQEEGFKTIEDDIKAKMSYVFSIVPKEKHDENLFLHVSNMVEDFLVEDGILRNRPEFRYVVPVLNLTSEIMFSEFVLSNDLANDNGDKFSETLTKIMFLRTTNIALKNELLNDDIVSEANEILNLARTGRYSDRNKCLVDMYEFIWDLQEQEENDDDDEQEQQNGNNQGDENGESSSGENEPNGDSDQNQEQDSDSGKDGNEGQGNKEKDQQENPNSKEGNGNKSGKGNQSQNQNGKSQNGNPQNGKGEKTEMPSIPSDMRIDGLGDLSKEEVEQIVKELNKQLFTDEMLESKKENEKWVFEEKATVNFDKESLFVDIESNNRDDGIKYLPKFSLIAQLFSRMKLKSLSYGLHQKSGDLLGNSFDGLFDNRPFDAEVTYQNKFKRAKVVITVDVSGSTDSTYPKIDESLAGHLGKDMLSCAYSMFEVLSAAGFPCAVIAHTANHHRFQAWRIASNDFRSLPDGEIETTTDNEARFASAWSNTNHSGNADGYILEVVNELFLGNEFSGDNVIISFSDGMPSAAPYGNATDYLKKAIVEVRETGTKIISFAAIADVYEPLCELYGSDWVVDVSGENLQESALDTMMNVIESY